MSPSAAAIRSAREAAGLTQERAAELVHCQRLAWVRWESGARVMDAAHWELFRIKAAKMAAVKVGG